MDARFGGGAPLVERSAAGACPQGHLGYALALARQGSDEPIRRQIAIELRRAADAELPTAMYLLAVITEKGIGVECDCKHAMQLYRRAAEKGHRGAQLRWGIALVEGRDVEQDLVTGESWLRQAALAGDPQAAKLIGDLRVGAARCRQITSRRQAGIAALPMQATRPPPAHWRHCM